MLTFRTRNMVGQKIWKNEKYGKLLENFSWDIRRRARKKEISEKRGKMREREGRVNWVKKLNVSPFACKHDRSSGFLYRFWYWRTPCGIVFISGRPFCVLLQPFVTGRNRPVLHFTCRACHATLLVQWVKEDRQKSGISARQIITITGNRYRSVGKPFLFVDWQWILSLSFYFYYFILALFWRNWIITCGYGFDDTGGATCRGC